MNQLPMPILLFKASFEPGTCKQWIASLKNSAERNQAESEYSYFSGSDMIFPISDVKTFNRNFSRVNTISNEGERLFRCYLMAYKAWRKAEYKRVIGITEAIFLFSPDTFPLLFLYLNLTAAAAAANLKDFKRTELYFQKAWHFAKQDDFLLPFSQMQGSLQGMVEKIIRKENPEAYKKIMKITTWISQNEYSKDTEHELYPIAMNRLTGREYAVAKLASQGWSNQEISEYFEISIRTVKYHMTTIFNKLDISSRRKLLGKLPH